MINYCIQIILFQALFLFVYDAFLSKETFFTKNRWYLLATSILSFVIPLIKIPSLQESLPTQYSTLLPEVILSPQTVLEQTSWMNSISYMNLMFWSGVFFFSVLFLRKVWKLMTLILANAVEKRGKYKLIYLPNSKEAFSFFNYIFIGKNISNAEEKKIIQHELVHSSQKHSLDLLLFEMLKIFMWFNPLLYVYQRRVSMLHEYISDAAVVKSSGRKEYVNQLINEVFDVQNIAFVNQFFIGSFIKKRIKMLSKEKSKGIKQLKYLLLVPMLLSMLFYISCSGKATSNKPSEETVVKGQLEEVVLGNQLADENKQNQDASTSIPFTAIDKIPTFPGCEENDKNCFNKNIQKHFATKFDADLPKKLGLAAGKKRLLALFVIDKNGEISTIKAKAPTPELEMELKRVIKSIPKMIPGEHQGKKVGVKYTLPIRIDVK